LWQSGELVDVWRVFGELDEFLFCGFLIAVDHPFEEFERRFCVTWRWLDDSKVRVFVRSVIIELLVGHLAVNDVGFAVLSGYSVAGSFLILVYEGVDVAGMRGRRRIAGQEWVSGRRRARQFAARPGSSACSMRFRQRADRPPLDQCLAGSRSAFGNLGIIGGSAHAAAEEPGARTGPAPGSARFRDGTGCGRQRAGL